MQQALAIFSFEALFSFTQDGRPLPWLAEAWSVSDDGTHCTLQLRHGVTFHDGTPVNSSAIKALLQTEIPRLWRLPYENVIEIRTPSEYVVELSLENRSRFLVESLGFAVRSPESPQSGTAPFAAATNRDGQVEMRANPSYYQGKPILNRILIKSYPSVRAAWAELLRDNVDMLYEAGIDALASLEPSTSTKVFAFQRPYTSIVLLNVQRDSLRDRAFRRELNGAINRTALIEEVLEGRGTPAAGPISPLHWAFDPAVPHFAFEPHEIAGSGAESRFTILLVEPSQELMLLAVQRQLQSAGIGVTLQQVSVDEYQKRLESRDFDAILVDAVHGPTMVRPALWWHSRGPLNFGRYSSPAADAALEAINRAPDDAAYKAGVAAFQRAIVDDPPAIFLAWSERARAVSTRFEVPVEPGRDILSTLRLWRPVGAPALAAATTH